MFNVFGQKSTFFKLRRPLIGAVMVFNVILVIGAFVCLFYGFDVYVEIVVVIFILISPFQLAVFAIYGVRVTRKLSKGASISLSVEVRWAQIRMFILTVVSIALWFFAFIFSILVAILGNSTNPSHQFTTNVVINVFCLFGVVSICATYAFVYFARHLLGSSHHDSSSEASDSHHHFGAQDNRKSSAPSDVETGSVVPLAPTSEGQEYKIGDLSIEL